MLSVQTALLLPLLLPCCITVNVFSFVFFSLSSLEEEEEEDDEEDVEDGTVGGLENGSGLVIMSVHLFTSGAVGDSKIEDDEDEDDELLSLSLYV